MKTFIRRLSSRGEESSAAAASATAAEALRLAPHAAGGVSGRVSPGIGLPKAVDFRAAWGRIHTTLVELTSDSQPNPSASWLALYTDVYRICTSPPHQGVHRRLYDHLHDFLCRHCEAVVAQLHQASMDSKAFEFLALYAR